MKLFNVQATLNTVLLNAPKRLDINNDDADSLYEDAIYELFKQFTINNRGTIVIKYDELWKALDVLKTSEEKLALIQAIKMEILRAARAQLTPTQTARDLGRYIKRIKSPLDISAKISTTKTTLERIAKSLGF